MCPNLSPNIIHSRLAVLATATYIHDAHSQRNNLFRFVFTQHLMCGHLPNERKRNNETEQKKMKS